MLLIALLTAGIQVAPAPPPPSRANVDLLAKHSVFFFFVFLNPARSCQIEVLTKTNTSLGTSLTLLLYSKTRLLFPDTSERSHHEEFDVILLSPRFQH